MSLDDSATCSTKTVLIDGKGDDSSVTEDPMMSSSVESSKFHKGTYKKNFSILT